MNFLRKLTLVIAEIILLLTVSVLLLAPDFMVRVANSVELFDPNMRILVAVAVDLLLAGAIISQLRGKARYTGTGLLVQSGDSSTSVTTESVRQNVIKAVSAISDIESVECETKSKGGEAILQLDVVTSRDDIHIPKKQGEIDRAIKQVVVKQMGVKLSKPPVVNIRLASDSKSAPAVVAPVAPKPAVAPSVSSSLSAPKEDPVEPESESES